MEYCVILKENNRFDVETQEQIIEMEIPTYEQRFF